jgi:hypothetical protein
MREFRSSGSVRGVPSNRHPYRDICSQTHANAVRSKNVGRETGQMTSAMAESSLDLDVSAVSQS